MNSCYIIFSGEEQKDEIFKIIYLEKIKYKKLLDEFYEDYEVKYNLIMNYIK